MNDRLIHHHSLPDTITQSTLKVKKYWIETSKMNFNSNVLEIKENWIRIADTLIYPEGGGQNSDKGTIYTENELYQFDRVIHENSKDWIYIADHKLKIGDQINVKLNENYRNSLSRNHTAQHLLSAILWEEFSIDTSSVKIQEVVTKLEIASPLSSQNLQSLINSANQYISESLPVSSYYFDKIPSKLKYRGTIDEQSIYRLVKIGDLDLNFCGGTHVSNLQEILSIFIIKNNNKVIEFTSGLESMNRYAELYRNYRNIMKIIGAQEDNLLNYIKILHADEKLLRKENNNLLEKINIQILQKSNWSKSDDVYYKIVEVQLCSPNILKILDKLTSNQVIIFFDITGNFLIKTANLDMLHQISLRLQTITSKFGGREYIIGKLSKEFLHPIVLFEKILAPKPHSVSSNNG